MALEPVHDLDLDQLEKKKKKKKKKKPRSSGDFYRVLPSCWENTQGTCKYGTHDQVLEIHRPENPS